MERTLNDPLSGAEIKEIICQEIRKRLDGDSTLLDDIAYAGFLCKFELKISFTRSLTKPTEVWGGIGAGDVIGNFSTENEKIDGEYKTDQPDVARQEYDLPIPVLAQTPNGPERRKVRIEKAKK